MVFRFLARMSPWLFNGSHHTTQLPEILGSLWVPLAVQMGKAPPLLRSLPQMWPLLFCTRTYTTT